MGEIVAELEKQKLISKDDQLMFGGKKYAVRRAPPALASPSQR